MSDVDGSVQSTSSELSNMSLNSDKKEGEKLMENLQEKGDLGDVQSTSSELSNTSLNTGKKKGGKLLEYLQEKEKLDDEEDDGDFSEEHEKYKLRYYREKFKIGEDER